jgi:pantoate kinase
MGKEGNNMKSRGLSHTKHNPTLERLLVRKQCIADDMKLLHSEIKELKEELRHKQSLIREINVELVGKNHKETELRLVHSS